MVLAFRNPWRAEHTDDKSLNDYSARMKRGFIKPCVTSVNNSNGSKSNPLPAIPMTRLGKPVAQNKQILLGSSFFF